MHKDLIKPSIHSSFLSCEKDFETILKRLFISNDPDSNFLKRLLIISAQDCIDPSSSNNERYKQIVENFSLHDLREKGYIKLEPKIKMGEHEEVKTYIIISFDNFAPNGENPEFRDCIINFDILCHTDYWDIGDYKLRPLKIAGYIDGFLNKSKLSGIGQVNLIGCNQLVLNEYLSGYTLSYSAIHGTDDIIPVKE